HCWLSPAVEPNPLGEVLTYLFCDLSCPHRSCILFSRPPICRQAPLGNGAFDDESDSYGLGPHIDGRCPPSSYVALRCYAVCVRRYDESKQYGVSVGNPTNGGMFLRVSGPWRHSAPWIIRAEQETPAIARDSDSVHPSCDARGLAIQRIHASGNDLHVRYVRRVGKARLVAAGDENQSCRCDLRVSRSHRRSISICLLANAAPAEGSVDPPCISSRYPGRVFASSRLLMAATCVPFHLCSRWYRCDGLDFSRPHYSVSYGEGFFG